MPSWLMTLFQPRAPEGQTLRTATGVAPTSLRLPEMLAASNAHKLSTSLMSYTSGIPWLLEPLALAPTLVAGTPLYTPAWPITYN